MSNFSSFRKDKNKAPHKKTAANRPKPGSDTIAQTLQLVLDIARKVSKRTGRTTTFEDMRTELVNAQLSPGAYTAALMGLRSVDSSSGKGVIAGALLGANDDVFGVSFCFGGEWYGVFRPSVKGQEYLRQRDPPELMEWVKVVDVTTSGEEHPNASYLVKFKQSEAKAPISDVKIKATFLGFYELMCMQSMSLVEVLRKHLKDSCDTLRVPGLPPHWGDSWTSAGLLETLRPTPSFLLSLDDSVSIEIVAEAVAERSTTAATTNATTDTNTNPRVMPFVFDGVSGSGKTASALLVPEKMIRGSAGPESVICGIYISDYPHTVSLSNRIATKIKDSLSHLVQHASDKSVGNIIFYIVLDELGKHPTFAAHVIGDKGNLIDSLRRALRAEYADAEKCLFVFSLVGTGVTAPSPNGSLPRFYRRWPAAIDPVAVFESAVASKFAVHGTFRNDLVKFTKEQPQLMGLMMNVRCAMFLADVLSDLVKRFGWGEGYAEHSKGPDGLGKWVEANAGYFEQYVISNYIRVNGWGTLSVPSQRVYATWVLSLVMTQPQGYHLLPHKIIDVLVLKLGAVKDALRIEYVASKGDAGAIRGPTKGSCRYAPRDTVCAIKKNKAFKTRTEVGRVRFEVPLSSFIIAMNILVGKMGCGSVLTPALYETSNVVIMAAVANAFLWSAGWHNIRDYSFDLRCVLPSFAFALRDVNPEVKVKRVHAISNDQKEPVTNFDAWCAENTFSFIEIGQLDAGLEATSRNVWNQINSCGMAFVFAGDGTPLNDITIFTRKQTIGVELKYYLQGGIVGIDVLQKRAYQMGFGQMSMQFTARKVSLKLKGDQFVLPQCATEMLRKVSTFGLSAETKDGTVSIFPKLSESAIGKFGRLFHSFIRSCQYHSNNVGGKVLPKEVVVLCSPTSLLLPSELVCATFGSPELWRLKGDAFIKVSVAVPPNTSCTICASVMSPLRAYQLLHEYSLGQRDASVVNELPYQPQLRSGNQRLRDNGSASAPASRVWTQTADTLHYRVKNGILSLERGNNISNGHL